MTKDTTGSEKISLIDSEITEISQRIMEELETASSKDLSEAKYAKKILQLSDLHYTKNIFYEIESVPSGAERAENGFFRRPHLHASAFRGAVSARLP